jgi:hypothetical protein
MFKPSAAKSIREYLAAVPDKRKEEVLFLHAFIRKTVPTQKPYFANNMIGYGSFLYLNHKKTLCKWPIISLACQKNYISVYVCAMDNGQYVAQKYKSELGSVTVGKSCISFKSLDKIRLPILKKVLKEATKNPGFNSIQKADIE